ncbi:MAG: class I SAM-dependent RNA methyltransferase [Gemmatimonadales bacterium]
MAESGTAGSAEVTVIIDRLAAGGDGVGRLPDGKVIFVPRTAPGDRARVTVVAVKPRFARGRLVGLECASELRTTPPCRHYDADECGACQLQHITYDAQLMTKGRFIADALKRIGGRCATPPIVEPSPRRLGYRNKVTLAMGPEGTLGFRRHSRPAEVFAVKECPVLESDLEDLTVGVVAAASHLPTDTETVLLRRDGGVSLVSVGTGDNAWHAGDLARQLDAPGLTVARFDGAGLRVLEGDGQSEALGSFRQANAEVADRIRRLSVALLPDVDGRVVWDLFCGLGDTCALLAGRGARVTGVDSDAGAIAYAAGVVPEARFVVGPAEDVSPNLARPQHVIANPPRRGLAAALAELLGARLKESGGTLVYVSCDASTLARDLRRMPDLDLVGLHAFDMFPQTSHVETIAVLAP